MKCVSCAVTRPLNGTFRSNLEAIDFEQIYKSVYGLPTGRNAPPPLHLVRPWAVSLDRGRRPRRRTTVYKKL